MFLTPRLGIKECLFFEFARSNFVNSFSSRVFHILSSHFRDGNEFLVRYGKFVRFRWKIVRAVM